MINLKSNFEINNFVLLNFINLRGKEKDLVRNWRNCKNIRNWMYSNHLISAVEHEEFITKLKKDKKNFYWLAKNTNGEYAGVIYLNRVDLENKNAYLGIYVSSEATFTGAGYVLIDLIKYLAFKILNLHTLKLEVIRENKRAINFYKNVAFSTEGQLKDFVFKNGKWTNVIIMGFVNKRKG